MISTYKNVQKQSLFLTILGQSKKKEEKNFKRIWTIGRLSEATDSIQNKS